MLLQRLAATILAGTVSGTLATRETLRSALRTATDSVHRRLERGLLLSDPRLSKADYRQVLAAYYGFYRPLEARLAWVWPAGLDAARLHKRLWLAQDLQELGLSACGLAALPHGEGMPPLRDESEAMGCLYVLEGACLGGQVLLRSIQPRFDGEGGFRFLEGYGLETGRMWRNFLSCLNDFQNRDERDQQRLIASAVATFETFERWLALRECLR